MSLEGIKGGIASIQPIIRNEQIQGGPAPAAGEKKGGFGDMLVEAMKDLNQMQLDADQKIEDMIVKREVAPHEAMIALEKADIAFQMMNQVRSKIVRAYEEVLRTQV